MVVMPFVASSDALVPSSFLLRMARNCFSCRQQLETADTLEMISFLVCTLTLQDLPEKRAVEEP